MQTTWKPYTEHGRSDHAEQSARQRLCLPQAEKEPLTDASHVRNALRASIKSRRLRRGSRSRLRQYQGGREHYGVDINEKSWKELGR